MEYDWKSRKKLADTYEEEWRKKNRAVLLMLSGEQKQLLEELSGRGSRQAGIDSALYRAVRHYDGKELPSVFMRKNYRRLVECCVPKPWREDYYAIIDKYNRFQYAVGMGRRSMRSPDYAPFAERMFHLLQTYRCFGIYRSSMAEYLKNELEPELLDYKRMEYKPLPARCIDDCLAARIDAGDGQVIEAVREILLAENNTAVVTTDIIRAIVKSSEEGLHQLLCDFLVAARLQEGVRQAVCENADCGCMEAFLRIIDTIREKELLRFSAVKRAVATWTGVCSVEHMDRISEKVFGDIVTAVHDKNQALLMTKGDDSVHIMIGLWALGAWNVQDALAVMEGYVREGTRNQKLTMSYFNIGLSNGRFSSVTAKKMLEMYPEDLEMAAAFFPTYMQNMSSYVYHAAAKRRETGRCGRLETGWFYMEREEARRHFRILAGLYDRMPKKKLEISPCVFPWYGIVLTKGQLVMHMAALAYALEEDGLIDEVCPKLPDIGDTGGGYYSSRSQYIELLLGQPATSCQRDCLLSHVADRETMSRKVSYEIADKMELTEEEYKKLEGFLKYKDGDIRKNVLSLLKKRAVPQCLESAGRLLTEKSEEMHLGALDLLQGVKKENAEGKWTQRLAELLQELAAPTAKEKILVEEIRGGSVEDITRKEGFGLYDPAFCINVPQEKADLGAVQAYFCLTEKELDRIFGALTAFLDAHGREEYRDLMGNECLLCNGLRRIRRETGEEAVHELYPFPELWKEFYDTQVKTPQVLWNLYFALLPGMSETMIENYELYKKQEKKLFSQLSGYTLPDGKYMREGLWSSPILTVLNIMCSQVQARIPKEVVRQAILYITQEMPGEALWYPVKKGSYSYSRNREISFLYPARISRLVDSLKDWKNEEEFARMFWLFYRLDEAFAFEKHANGGGSYGNLDNGMKLNMADYVRAYTMDLVGGDCVYHAAIEKIGVKASVNQMGILMKEKLTPYEKKQYRAFLTGDDVDFESAVGKAGRSFYLKLVDVILDVELKRGDSPTVFSDSICAIRKIYGADRLVAILTALGADTLDRKTYYGFYGRSDGKRECLSHLLQVCCPAKEDTPKGLEALLQGSGIREERLIETAMYAPQWLDIIEGYLEWKGLKSGCYYFMAHMNERFDDRKQAMIAKYTPLTAEELNDGAFDVEWFWDAYRELGEKRFERLYRAAKYISDGSKHSRARKYADAALGKTAASDLEKEIAQKRNKNDLMSYGIIPVTEMKEILHRYEFLQQFLKESRQFGAQRRASEGRAVEMAMKNLATTAGYSDVTRLTLAMETQLVKENARYLEGITVEDCVFCIVIHGDGSAELEITKGGKKQKSVPAALRKNEEVLGISEFKKKLAQQYARTVKMFEQGMEDGEGYSIEELCALQENPVVGAVLSRLVWICGDHAGLLRCGGLCDVSLAGAGELSGEENGIEDRKDIPVYVPGEGEKVRVAHPWDLYRLEKWTAYQRRFFALCSSKNEKQPFKQVFRELYVKLPEEREKDVSRMFAGNQIWPAKTAACLKGRRWVADVEEGLQKIFYRENIIASIYAMADWFSPADTEAPTLEYVVFYNRKTFERMKIQDVPDIIYSEVMRDVDLAVSVAHAGGVDPETSHSTVEMRRLIVQFNLELFGLTNVTFEKSHVVIAGSRADYSVHLGSGVIHQLGRHQINVLPVHSQSRGKVFLPFLDEDPKTAEIMSKILLFAQDTKIKDPYILDQIVPV